jgi:predicted nucleic acid-binding protein
MTQGKKLPALDKQRFVLDSSAIILHLNKNINLTSFLNDIPEHEKIVSIITFMEVLAKPAQAAEREQEARQFLADCTIADILPAIRDKTILIRRTKNLKLPDSIIAATSIILNATLLSYDPHHLNLRWPGYRSQTANWPFEVFRVTP